jgi:hypothetical protein
VVLGHRQARVAGRDAAPQRGADVLGDVDGHDRRDRRHDLARLLVVEMKDAREHPRLARVEVTAGVRVGDDRAHLLGARALLEVGVALDAQRSQQRARCLVEQVDERPHDRVEGVQRPRDPARDPLGVDDRVDLRHLFAGGDVPRRDEDVGDRDRHRRGDRMGEALQPWLDELGDRRLAQEADAQRGQRDAELAGRQVLAEVVELGEHEPRPAVAAVDHLLDPGAARAHERELRGDEEAVGEDQHDDRADEQQRGQEARTGPGLGCRPRLRGRSSFI